jgi:Zn finger protein HypA/HybF involved in hydrogenase expression
LVIQLEALTIFVLKLSKEEFIERSVIKHNGKFDYSKVIYINSNSKIEILCKEHGSFWQRAKNHMHGRGCSQCYDKNISNTNEFITKSNIVHKNKFSYENTIYVNAKTKVEIKCNIHGTFLQLPSNHLAGAGCPACAGKLITTISFVEKAKSIHGDKYDYSSTKYKSMRSKIMIECKTHGTFKQTPQVHLNGSGCKKCHIEFLSLLKSRSYDDFVAKANLIHGGKYQYKQSLFFIGKDKIGIVCFKHGTFEQLKGSHLSGNGCPKCKSSKGETKIRNILKDYKIIFEEQKIFNQCIDKTSLKFDFYLPDYNLCIEYDGRHHFGPFSFGKCKNKQSMEKNYKDVFKKDQIKNNFCKKIT